MNYRLCIDILLVPMTATTTENKFSHIKNMVFEGGGILGTAYTGAINELASVIDFSKVNHYAGTSAGAIVAAALACRASPDFIMNEMTNANFSSFVKITFTGIAVGLPLEYGICTGHTFERWFSRLVNDLTGSSDITLKDVYEKYGTTFTCAVTNISTGQPEYFNTDTHPTMKLTTAVRASMSIPFIFKPVIIDGQFYIDGGLIDNFMIAKFDPRYTLGVSLIANKQPVTINSIGSYIHAVVNSLTAGITPDTLADVIRIHCGDRSSIDFGLSKDNLLDLVSRGRDAAIEYIKAKS